MKKTTACLLACLLLLLVTAPLGAFADRNDGEYLYTVLDDGTAEIIMYGGEKEGHSSC